jgi:hypothetical protein
MAFKSDEHEYKSHGEMLPFSVSSEFNLSSFVMNHCLPLEQIKQRKFYRMI